ncbi:MAG: protein-glutamate O-methyltransferase CheR [Calditrichaeota bacterium]|nr:MAG: protein-glutamate O-methyltransferase CheR [Calditrichota bacterium]
MPAPVPLRDHEYKLISGLVYRTFGIVLSEQKRSLIVGRLNRILRQNGHRSFKEYYDYVVADRSGRALSALVDRISTNHTYFYREKEHFDYLLEQVLPELSDRGRREQRKVLRIWCSACSSGEEPYTLAMLLCEFFGSDLHAWDTGILATDISTRMLAIAKEGIYSAENVARLPEQLRDKYFDAVEGGRWRVKKALKELVVFRRLNLIRNEYPFKGRFHIVFSRNVMIYFDESTRNRLVARYHRYMEPDGYLFVGHSESLGQNNRFYRYVRPAVYQKKG